VIVVDNNSNDGEIANFKRKFAKVQFIESEQNLGFGAGCHLGALQAQAGYLLFLNPDTQANSPAVAAMLSFLIQNPSFGIVSCQQHSRLAKHKLLFPNFFRLFGAIRAVEGLFMAAKFEIKTLGVWQFITPDWVSGSVLMISKQNYEKLGGWTNKLWMYFEDPDICLRAKALGLDVALLTNQTIYHKHGGATRLNLATAALTKTEVTISRHVYIQMHFSAVQKYMAHIWLIISFLLGAGLAAVLGSLFFFVPKLKLQTFIFKLRWAYYKNALKTGSWLSPRLQKIL
jgi:GT2 family glycosyltransferase